LVGSEKQLARFFNSRFGSNQNGGADSVTTNSRRIIFAGNREFVSRDKMAVSGIGDVFDVAAVG
jgi:hypothetical protein